MRAIPPRDDSRRPVGVRVPAPRDLALEVREPGRATLPSLSVEMLEGVVEVGEDSLRDVTVDPPDPFLVVGTPPREVSARTHGRDRPPLLPPRFHAPFERVVPKGPQLLELAEEFPLLIRKRLEAELLRVIHRCSNALTPNELLRAR